MNIKISQAIRDKRVLIFSYDGYPRTVEPHCHGITTAGNEALRCYQIAGDSASGTVPGWHIMKVNKIIGLTVSQAVFAAPRPEYKRGDRGMSTIYEEL